MLGILVVEDVVVVILLAMLENVAVTNAISVTASLWLVVKLVVFIGGTLVVGSLVLPRIIDRVAKVKIKSCSTS